MRKRLLDRVNQEKETAVFTATDGAPSRSAFVSESAPRRLAKGLRRVAGLSIRGTRSALLRAAGRLGYPVLGGRAPLSGRVNARDYARAAGAEFIDLDPGQTVRYGRDGASFATSETFVTVVPNGRVLGHVGAVVTADNRLVSDVSIAIALPDWRHPALMRARLPAPRRIEGSAAVISSVLPWNYWHWMIDVLPRIGLLERAGFGGERLVVNADLPFQKQTLAALGIGEERLIRVAHDAQIEVERLILPSLPEPFCTITPETIAFLRAHFLPAGEQPAPNRLVYISRKDAARRRVLNEDELMRRLAPYGFEAVSLGDLSVIEQARLFASARLVVGPHGAGFTNMVFARSGAALLEIMPDYGHHPSFEMVTSLLGCGYGKIDYAGPRVPPDDQTVDIDAILRAVDTMLTRADRPGAGRRA